MNIAFFLTPKSEVICENLSSTMRQAIERMEYHSYTAIPLIDDKGIYVGTLTEGDLLWKLKNTPELTFKNSNKIKISDITLRVINKPVSINADIENLISLAVSQNFVPVVDDDGVFIGIIKRSDIINYWYKKLSQNQL
jgi:CBS-domain-containing membrane protein